MEQDEIHSNNYNRRFWLLSKPSRPFNRRKIARILNNCNKPNNSFSKPSNNYNSVKVR